MEAQEYQQIEALSSTHWWYQSLVHVVSESFAHLPTNARILDAGCGTGYLLDALRTNTFGVDVSEQAASIWARKSIPHVSRASIDALPFPDTVFDGVVAIDVLYHRGVAHDVCALGEICRVTKPGGRILLHVPAFNVLLSDHDRVVHTERRYTRHTVEQMVRRAGLEPIHLSYRNASAVLPICLRKLLRSSGSNLAPVAAPLNTIAGRLSRWEWRLIAAGFSVPIGSSIVCVATRPVKGAG